MGSLRRRCAIRAGCSFGVPFRFSPTQPWFGPPNFEKLSLVLRLLTVFACVEYIPVGGAIGGHAIFVSNAFDFADFALGAPLKAPEVKVRFATVSPKTNAAVIGATVKTIGAQQRRCIWLKFLSGEPMSAGGFCPAIWSPRWQASRARQGRGRPRLFSSWHSAFVLPGSKRHCRRKSWRRE